MPRTPPTWPTTTTHTPARSPYMLPSGCSDTTNAVRLHHTRTFLPVASSPPWDVRGTRFGYATCYWTPPPPPDSTTTPRRCYMFKPTSTTGRYLGGRGMPVRRHHLDGFLFQVRSSSIVKLRCTGHFTPRCSFPFVVTLAVVPTGPATFGRAVRLLAVNGLRLPPPELGDTVAPRTG